MDFDCVVCCLWLDFECMAFYSREWLGWILGVLECSTRDGPTMANVGIGIQ